MALLMTQAEYAERHGVGKSAVSNWKSKGLLVFTADPARPGKQLVDVTKSDLLVRGTIDPTRGRPRGEAGEAQQMPDDAGDEAPRARGPAPTPMETARLEEMRERTTRRRIENERLVGSLVSIAEYERRAGDMGRLVRERTHGLIRQHAERLAAETDPRTIMVVLGEAFDALFNQVADEIEAAASQEQAVDQVLEQLADVEPADDLVEAE